MIFAHRYETFRKKQMEAFEDIVRSEGLSILGASNNPNIHVASTMEDAAYEAARIASSAKEAN